MFSKIFTVFIRRLPKYCMTTYVQHRSCSVFGLKELIQQDKLDFFSVHQITNNDHEMAIDVIKRHYLSEHVLVRTRNMDLNDRALDEYLITLMKQGNALYAKAQDDTVAGVCVNYASSPVDPGTLRAYAYYRQNINTKNFLCFTATLQETPNLWTLFNEPKMFEIKMLAVLPQFRRQGLAVMLTEKSKELALDQQYKIIRMDCVNPFDHKVAERCLLQYLVKFPLHRLCGINGPYIKRDSDHMRYVRVYVDVRAQGDAPDQTAVKQKQIELEDLLE